MQGDVRKRKRLHTGEPAVEPDETSRRAEFLKLWGEDYGYGGTVEGLRRREFTDCGAFLDHAGSTLYARTQIEHASNLILAQRFGNPHSQNAAGRLAADAIASARRRVLRFFNASDKLYDVVFTSGATAALKMVGEYFPWSESSVFYHTLECHNSLLGCRGYAQAHRARVESIPWDKMDEKLAMMPVEAGPTMRSRLARLAESLGSRPKRAFHLWGLTGVLYSASCLHTHLRAHASRTRPHTKAHALGNA